MFSIGSDSDNRGMTGLECRIIELCRKAVASSDSDELKETFAELYSVLRENSLRAQNVMTYMELHREPEIAGRTRM